MEEAKTRNLRFYTALRSVPEEAQRTITAGRLKGMTDINPMWRTKAITEVFGPCGIGWRYEVARREFKECEKTGETTCFVDVNFYFVDPETGAWSEAIPGTGGSKFCSMERNGAYCSDECYKMALTDALSVAFKQIGVAADIYFKNDPTKYPTNPVLAGAGAPNTKPCCTKCGRPLRALKFASGQTLTLEQAREKFNGLCYDCWKKQQAEQKEAQA